MKIKANELSNILTLVKPALAKKQISNQDQQTHFIFTGKEIQTFNDEMCISHPFECEFKFSIQAEEIYKILNRLGEAEITLSLKKDKLYVDGKRLKIKISTLPLPDEYAPISYDVKWRNLPGNFLEGIKLCSFSASRDSTEMYLTTIKVDEKFIISSDDLRISRFRLSKSMKQNFLLPISHALHLVNYPVLYYGMESPWIHFRTRNNVFFSSKMLEVEYPNISEFFKIPEKTKSFRLPEKLKRAIDDVGIMAEGEVTELKKIKMTITKGKIICKGEKDIGWFEREIKIKEYKGKDITIYINPIFLSQVLTRATVFYLIEQESPRVVFVNNDFEHTLALFVEGK